MSGYVLQLLKSSVGPLYASYVAELGNDKKMVAPGKEPPSKP
jgi:hypothetical protein